MSRVYLIRHGQAGPRFNYDTLSGLGRTQARLLGEYLAAQQVRFTALYSGRLRRQQQTAAEVIAAYRGAGLEIPLSITDPDWDEFDLDKVYEELAPQLIATDPQFKSDYEGMLRVLPDEHAEIHRRWSSCDIAVIRAWIEGLYPCRVESWPAFRERVGQRLRALARHGSGESIAVFTSATPIAVWVGMALAVANGNLMRLAGVIYNSSITTLRIRQDQLMLFSFNGVPHLTDPRLRSFR